MVRIPGLRAPLSRAHFAEARRRLLSVVPAFSDPGSAVSDAGPRAAAPADTPGRMRAFFQGVFLKTWPPIWWLVRTVDRMLPRQGRLRRAFTDAVFTRPWSRWQTLSFDPVYRDTFFAYILTFFYRYPVRKGDIVVQIGASFGEETQRFVGAVGRRGRVFAIEPEDRNVEVMRGFLPQRRWPQLTVIQRAAGKTAGEFEFLVGGSRQHRLADIPAEKLTFEFWGVERDLDASRYHRGVKVQVDTLDDILRPYALERIDFVLVETNGTELEVVEGINELFSIIKRLGVRGHVKRDGVPVHLAIDRLLREKGYDTHTTSEGMVLAERR